VLKYILSFLVGMLLAIAIFGDDYGTDFIHVINRTTGVRSVALCGPGGNGLFVNSTDTGGVSCIDADGPQVLGGLVWVRMNTSIYVETTCAQLAFTRCGVLPGQAAGCSIALPYQAFRPDDLAYVGESETLGGPITQPSVKEFVCPTPRPAPSVTAPSTSTPSPLPGSSSSSTPSPASPPSSPPSQSSNGVHPLAIAVIALLVFVVAVTLIARTRK
jgi:hypothetical protein